MFQLTFYTEVIMAHTVLARKWRPKKFADLVGQQQTRTILQNLLSSGRLHHAYLLTGTRGVGKTTIARIIAKALNCLQPVDSEPCGTCGNCQSIDSGRFVDVIEIDAASNTGVDNVRELIDDAKYAPATGKYKIYIIDEVHMLSKSAFNAMLKTLEEPPPHAIFILATTDPQKVPITILSRCLQLKLRNLLASEITGHLNYILHEEQVPFEDNALPLIAKAAHGSMRDALSLLDQAIAFNPLLIKESIVAEMLGLSDNEKIYAILDAIISSNTRELISIAKSCNDKGEDFANILDSLREKLCQISISQLSNTSIDPDLNKYCQRISISDTHLYFEIANIGLQQLELSRDKYLVFIMTLLRMTAFRLGSQDEKQITINAGNFNSVITLNTVTAEQVLTKSNIKSEINPDTIVAVEVPLTTNTASDIESNKPQVNITSDVSITETDSPITRTDSSINIKQVIFTGDWFHLIINLKAELGYLYPVLENAKLIQHKDYTFDILIDARYEDVMSFDAMNKVSNIFNTYFNVKTTLNFSFAGKVDGTLKEKHTQDVVKKQGIAEDAIKNDENLNHILSQFSATIIPGSIKPI